MPSKGILCYSYIAVPGVEIEFNVPKNSITKGEQQQFSCDHLEVESSNLGHFKFTGRFEFVVRRDGRELVKQWVDVNSMTGGLSDGTMKTMDETPSIFTEDIIVSYGFYDAGPGLAALPKQHQCYVTATPNYENWMRDVLPSGSDIANKPFNHMVLPSSHDIGMNSMATAMSLLEKAGTGVIKEVLGRSLPRALSLIEKVGDKGVNAIAPDIIRALAVTQKDSLETILKLGARYFEFRPARCHRQIQSVSPLEDTLFFQHGAIPGMRYADFLSEIVRFLKDHGDEIVVVQNRWDGVPGDCPKPDDNELHNFLTDALRDSDIAEAGLDDMQNLSVQALRDQHKRLIVLRDINQVSNYDDDANATLTGDSMVQKLQSMTQDPPRGHPITLLQCQATATNIRDVIIASVLDSDTIDDPWHSIFVLWSQYGLQFDVQYGLSFAFADNEHNADFRHHRDVANTVGYPAIEGMVKYLEDTVPAPKLQCATVASSSLIPANNQYTVPPMQAASNTGNGVQVINTFQVPSSAHIPASQPILANTIRPLIRCPGDKNGAGCEYSTKQHARFKEHFADNHMRTYLDYICNCGKTFSKNERGKRDFAMHVWEDSCTRA
ncbi:hypothetical protein E8E13_002238 [Curvularia kusanoi]|uniref:PLC-like phosphodiesterase n=1 Tax=Curvularia kusanoi TaxID=90978 RepID=A0A9P4T5B2_CURKU|nr:hypothetical protein E8E13_002238 [Curvularia kusanoi]